MPPPSFFVYKYLVQNDIRLGTIVYADKGGINMTTDKSDSQDTATPSVEFARSKQRRAVRELAKAHVALALAVGRISAESAESETDYCAWSVNRWLLENGLV